MYSIYRFTNKHNNKKYVGCTVNLNDRVSAHLRNSRHAKTKFEVALKEFGVGGFVIDVIETNIVNETAALDREKHYIKLYNSQTNGYNSTPGGKGIPKGTSPWNKGTAGAYSQEYRDKLSRAKIGKSSHRKGKHNPNAASNGKHGAIKMKSVSTGRTRYYKPDGTWTWCYVRRDGTKYVREKATSTSKMWKEKEVT